MKYFALFIVCLFMGCNETTKVTESSYTNPLLDKDSAVLHLADPFVYKYDSLYYMTGTGGLQDGNFVCYVSSDLITWEKRGALYQKPAGHVSSSLFWAPEVKFYKGKFYLTYSCYFTDRNLMQTCLAVSDRPEGPFKDLYTPWFDLGYSAIDSHIFVDDDGIPYLYYSKNGMYDKAATGEIYVVKLKEDLSGLDGKPVFVSGASQEWERVAWERNRCNEGPSVFKRDGRYYMTYSGNDTGYEFYGVGVSTASHPLGPWVKYADNPLMTTDLSKGISSPGHNSLVEAPDGSLYIVYHRHADPHCQKPNWDRVVCMDRLYFDENGKLCTDGPTNTAQKVEW